MFVFSFLLTGCSEVVKINRNSKDIQILSGRFNVISNVSSMSAQQMALGCASPQASLYKINSDGDKVEPEVATTSLTADGKYSFDLKKLDVSFKNKVPDNPLIVTISDCDSGVYSRPITGPNNQDVSMGSSVLSYIMNTDHKSKLYDILKESPAMLDSLIKKISTTNSLQLAYEELSTNASIQSTFVEMFSVSSNVLEIASPEITSVTLPKNGQELGTINLSVNTLHWSTSYVPVFIWKLDGVVIGSSHDLTWTPSANSQGQHLLSLVTGESNGSGSIDLTKPTKTVSGIINIVNNILPVAADFEVTTPVVSGSTPISARALSITIDKSSGPNNCELFSKLALVEESAIVPKSSAFNIACTTTGTQTVSLTLLSPGDGAKTLRLWTMDSAGVISITPSVFTFNIDTNIPTVSIADINALTNSSSKKIVFSGEDNGGTINHYECQIDGAAFEVCSSPKIYSSLLEGDHTFSLKAVDTAGNISAVLSKAWHIDLTSPALILSSTPNAVTNQLSSMFTFSATDMGGGALSGYECSVDSTPYSSCISPLMSVLSAGVHNIKIRAQDSAGNFSAIQNYSWTIDVTPPTSSITSKPSIVTNSTNASFSFSGLDTGGGVVASFECQLDNLGYSACTSPKSFSSLTDTAHSFQVRSIDTAGNVGTSQSYSWTIDLTTPLASINSSPDSITNSTTASFSFSANPPPTGSIVGYECSINGGAFTACASPKTYPGLTQGNQTFEVKSIDNNNARSTAVSYTWHIDTTAPVLTVTSVPVAQNNSSTANFIFTGTDNGGATVDGYQCKLNSGSFVSCSSPVNLTGLVQGSYSYQIKVLDTAGNESAVQTFNWIIDTTNPSLTITAKPNTIVNTQNANFNFTGSDTGGSSLSDYECSIDGGSYSVCVAPKSFTGLSAGSHTFAIRVLDTVGNMSEVASYNWIIDLNVPTLSITSKPVSVTNSTSASFSFTGSDTGGANVDHYECKLDSGSYANCTSPKAYSSLAAGAHTFSVKVIDTAGNESLVSTYSWTIDTTAPTIAITTPATNGTFIPVAQISSFTVGGTCSENTRSVQLSGASTLSAICNSGSWTTNIDVSALGDGSLSLVATHTDLAGNSTISAARTFIKDTTLPVINITSPSSTRGNGAYGSVSWSLTEANVGSSSNFTVDLFNGSSWTSIGTKAASTGSNTNQGYTLSGYSVPNIDISNAKIRISITDASGNVRTSQSSDFIIDKTPAVLTSVSINDGAEYAGSPIINVKINFTDNNALTGSMVRMKFATGGLAGDCQNEYADDNWQSWSSSTYNYNMTLATVDGTKKVCIWAKDAVGNVTTTTPSLCTIGVDCAQIKLEIGNAPQITSFNVVNTANGLKTASSGEGITISWTLSDIEGLDNNPISIAYTTDNSTWKDISTDASIATESNMTWLGSLSGNPTSYSDTLTTFNSPSSSYFKLRAITRDTSGNYSVVAFSQPMNTSSPITGTWSVYAGSTDRGDGGGGLSAVLNQGSSPGRHFTIDPKTNDVYATDEKSGIRKLDIKTGKVSTFVAPGAHNLVGLSGAIPTKITGAINDNTRTNFDKLGNMYLSFPSGSSLSIYKLDLANNAYLKYAGGGSKNDDTGTALTSFIGLGDITFDEDNTMYYFTECDTAAPGGSLKPKRLMKLTQNVDGSAGIVSIVAGNCTYGTPAATGQDAVASTLGPVNSTTALYTRISSIVPLDHGRVVYFSIHSAHYKVVNGKLYKTNLSNLAGMSLVYNYFDQKIYGAGTHLMKFSPVLTESSNGEVLETVVSGSGTNNCVKDGVDRLSACIASNAKPAFDSSGTLYFGDGTINNATSSYRIRYIDSNSAVRTLFGSLGVYGDGLAKELIRGPLSGLYYKKASEGNQDAFPEGLYIGSPGMVFGYIDPVTGIYKTLLGSQQGDGMPANGTVISPDVTMGRPYVNISGAAMTFDNLGLPWLRVGQNHLYKIDADKKIVAMTAGSLRFEHLAETDNPQIGSVYIYGGYQNFALKGQGLFLIGSYYDVQQAEAPNVVPQVRFLDFTNSQSPILLGKGHPMSEANGSSPDIGAGLAKTTYLSKSCINTAKCTIQFSPSQDRLYFTEAGNKIRYIQNPDNTAISSLNTLPFTAVGSIDNFILKEDNSQLFYTSGNGLYCYDVGGTGKSWCNNSTNLYPYWLATQMGSISYAPNQLTWKNSNTMLISNGNGQILEFILPP